jgi:UDP-N-acetyl-D-glucosamine dehydrogenase
VFTVSSPAVAEMEKILENTYRNVNIGLVNELAILCQSNGHQSLGGHRSGQNKALWLPGFLSGAGAWEATAFPLDPYYLSWKAREYGFHTSMIESSMMINDKMPEYCVERASKILNQDKKALNGSKDT